MISIYKTLITSTCVKNEKYKSNLKKLHFFKYYAIIFTKIDQFSL